MQTARHQEGELIQFSIEFMNSASETNGSFLKTQKFVIQFPCGFRLVTWGPNLSGSCLIHSKQFWPKILGRRGLSEVNQKNNTVSLDGNSSVNHRAEPPPIPSNAANLTPWTKSNFLAVPSNAANLTPWTKSNFPAVNHYEVSRPQRRRPLWCLPREVH